MKVKIKTWEKMRKEYGIDKDGCIYLGDNVFTKNMERLLPEDRIINITSNECNINLYNWFSDCHSYPYIISDNMIDITT